MDQHRMGRAPNYKNACVVMFGVNITWILVMIWAIWGLIAAAVLAWGLNRLMAYAHVWIAQRQAASIRRGKHVGGF